MCPRFPLLHLETKWWACKRCPRRRQTQPWLCLSRPSIETLRWQDAKLQDLRPALVCHGGRQKGNAVSKQRMAHWIVDAITLAYQAQGVPCPFRLRAHSTRSVASSWALACGASLTDIVELRAGRPLTHSLDSIAFVWNRFPPVFSPQTCRSTEGPRFRVGLLKTAPESPTVDPVELLHPLGSWTWQSVRRQALTRWIPENR